MGLYKCDTLWQATSLLLNMCTEILSCPINSIVMFQSYVAVYQRAKDNLFVYSIYTQALLPTKAH